MALLILKPSDSAAQFSQAWSHSPSQSSFAQAESVDKVGNLVILGGIKADAEDPTVGAKVKLFKYDQDGALIWSKTVEAANSSYIPVKLVLDEANNIYFSGKYWEGSNAGGFISKYSPGGQMLWMKKTDLSTETTNTITDFVVDKAGSVYMVGNGTDGSQKFIGTSKLSISGGEVWSKKFSNEDGEGATAFNIAVDNLDGVYISTNDTVPSAEHSSYAGRDLILVKYHATTGEQLFVKKHSEPSLSLEGNPSQLITTPSGSIYFIANRYQSPYEWHATILKYNSSGTLMWQKRASDSFDHQNIQTILAEDESLVILTRERIYRWVTGDNQISLMDKSGQVVWKKMLNTYGQRELPWSPIPTRRILPKSLSISNNKHIAITGETDSVNIEGSGHLGSTFTTIEKSSSSITIHKLSGEKVWEDKGEIKSDVSRKGIGLSFHPLEGFYFTEQLDQGTDSKILATRYKIASTIQPDAWVSQSHTYNPTTGIISVTWKLNVSEARPNTTSYKVYHSSTDNGQLQSWNWDMPAGKTSVEAVYQYALNKMGSTDKLVFGVAEGSGYKIPNTTEKPKEVSVALTNINIEPEAWVSQTHSYDKASKTITVNWKLSVSEAVPSVTKYNVSHSSTENGQVQNHVWDMPAGKASVEGAYAYPLSKIESTESLVFKVAAGSGYKVPNTSARPSQVSINVKEVTGGIDPAITTKALTTNTLCAGAAVAVTFTTTGDFGSGNTFSAQLSNASGSFASPVVIGSGNASPISATIPAGTVAGTGYRIRIVASNPSTTGSDNGTNITIGKGAAKPAAITGSTSVCAGTDNLVYYVEAVDGAKEYIWSAPGFEIRSGQGSQRITLKAGTASGKVSVVAKGDCGTSAASELAVSVSTMPAVAITTEGGSSVCAGGQVKLKAPTGTGYAYQWMKGGSAISGATGATLSVSTSGSYSVKVTSSAGCTAMSAAVEVKVNAPFEVKAGENQTVCSNLAAFNLTGFSPAGGTWSGKGVSTGGSFNPATAGVGTHELTYTVTKDNCSVASSKTVTVSAAVGKPGAITGQSAACAGTDNLTFSVAEVSGAAEFIWSAPGFEIKSGQGTRTITLKAGTTSGKVSVVAKGGCGSSEPSEKQLTVNPMPTVSLAVFSQICSNAAPITLSGGLPEGGTYSGPGVSGGQFDPKAAGPGTHTITYAYSASGCGASATQAITVKGDCNVTGIEDKEPKYKLAVYPNPADSHVKIELELERPTELTVRLVDMRGSVLLEQRLGTVRGEVRHSVDVSRRAQGLYLLQLLTDEGVKTRRVVVQ